MSHSPRMTRSRRPRPAFPLTLGALAVAALLSMLPLGSPVLPAGADPVGTVTNYPGSDISGPYGIVPAQDGNLWFTNSGNNSIGRITPAGTLTNYPDATISGPTGIVEGPDSNLWFANNGNNSIGRITPTGTVTNYTGTGISNPTGIAVGPDGNLWFTNYTNDSIGRITPTGTVTNYTGTGISHPNAITAGQDGNLWFTNATNASIGRITPTGTVTNYTGSGILGPSGITTGPDGNLWFANNSNDSIGRITPTGTVTSYPDTGTGISAPFQMTTGPDGNLWFTNIGNSEIGRITPTGTITSYTGTGISSTFGITTGPDNNIWFANHGNDSIGRIVPAGPAPSFTDVPAEHPFFTEISWLAAEGITSGYSDGTFRPASSVSRQAMASFLYKYAGQPSVTLTEPYFADVPADHPFYAAIQWMADSGLSTGTAQPGAKPLFRPTALVSRQALAAFLWRYAGMPDSGLTSAHFADVTSGTFFDPVQWMASSGLSTGSANPPGKPLFNPTVSVTRQATAAFLYRYDLLPA